jgi:hypothetical protein
LFQFSAEQLPALQKQLKQQEEKVRAAAPDPAHVKKLKDAVAKAQTGTDLELLVKHKFMTTFL